MVHSMTEFEYGSYVAKWFVMPDTEAAERQRTFAHGDSRTYHCEAVGRPQHPI